MLKRSRQLFVLTVALIAGWVGAPSTARAQDAVTSMLITGRNKLNDLDYGAADSIAKRVIALGSLLTPDQKIKAIQLSIAALYPDEDGKRHDDQAIAMIKDMVAAGTTTIPKDLSWPGLDSLVAMVARASVPGKVLVGSRIPGSVLYLNGTVVGPITGLKVLPLQPGSPMSLSIRAVNCKSWDTTMTVHAADSVRVGYRNPTCP